MRGKKKIFAEFFSIVPSSTSKHISRRQSTVAKLSSYIHAHLSLHGARAFNSHTRARAQPEKSFHLPIRLAIQLLLEAASWINKRDPLSGPPRALRPPDPVAGRKGMREDRPAAVHEMYTMPV